MGRARFLDQWEMADIEQIRKLLGTSTLSGGVDAVAIQEAEAKLSVHFPPSYRTFLSHFGAALCTGFEIAGLFADGNGDGPPRWSNVVASTMQKQRISGGLLPKEFVAISDDGGDCTFYLDTSRQDAQGECPVVGGELWGHP